MGHNGPRGIKCSFLEEASSRVNIDHACNLLFKNKWHFCTYCTKDIFIGKKGPVWVVLYNTQAHHVQNVLAINNYLVDNCFKLPEGVKIGWSWPENMFPSPEQNWKKMRRWYNVGHSLFIKVSYFFYQAKPWALFTVRNKNMV